jgi:hypothetical protein
MPKLLPSRIAVNNTEKGHTLQARDLSQECTNIIKRNLKTRKMDLSEKFTRLLNEQYPLQEILIVSVCGARHNGKSFLADTLLSLYENQTLRVFCKAPNEGCNTQLRKITNSSGRPVLILDWQGYEKIPDDIDEDSFLFMYMVSSVIIYNQLGYDARAQ